MFICLNQCNNDFGAIRSRLYKNGFSCKHFIQSYDLGSELWDYEFDDLLSLVKEYVVGVWDARKQKLYGDDSCPSQLQSLAEDLQLAGVEGQMDGKLCSSGEGGTDGKDFSVCACVCGSTHDCGCMVNGSNAMVAS